MKDVYLYGKLAKDFLPHTRLDVCSPAEVAMALTANFGDRFVRSIREGAYRITVGREDAQKEIGPEQITFGVAGDGQIHIHPVIEGAGAPGRIVLGSVLVAASFIPQVNAIPFVGNTLRSFGVSLILGGTAELLTPSPTAGDTREGVDQNPSFIYGGPINLQAEGHAIPLVYGRMRVGSYIVNGYSTVAPVRDFVTGQGVEGVDTFYVPEVPGPEDPEDDFYFDPDDIPPT